VTDLTILMPCLDEAETLGTCIRKAQAWASSSGVPTEILVADNGSTDGSVEIAEALGARVVRVPERGYGAALYAGCAAASGRWIVLGDADDSYDFSRLDLFVERLRDGYDLVMGNRFQGGIEPGAMPWKNRYVGNPVLSRVGRILFGAPVADFHCGLRGLSKDAFERMDLRTTGMEFASEMVIKASQAGMRIAEVPTTLSRDGRSRPPHLRPWRDGWRHLRFMMLFSPRWLFVIPGLLLFGVSLLVYVRLLWGPWALGQVTLDVHTLFFAQAGLTLGLLAVLTGVVARALGTRDGLFPAHRFLAWLDRLPAAEIGALVGAVVTLAGFLWGVSAVVAWGSREFGPISGSDLLRTISLSTTLLTNGGIVFVFSLLLGFISLPTRSDGAVPTRATPTPADT
jgi:glycosyltransferase involved in cell wall biosynthesis